MCSNIGYRYGQTWTQKDTIKTLAKMFKPRWVLEDKCKPCNHTPPVPTPHDGIVSSAMEICGQGLPDESMSMGSMQVWIKNPDEVGVGGLSQNTMVANSIVQEASVSIQINGISYKLVPCST